MWGSLGPASGALSLDRRTGGLTSGRIETYRVSLDLFRQWCDVSGMTRDFQFEMYPILLAAVSTK